MAIINNHQINGDASSLFQGVIYIYSVQKRTATNDKIQVIDPMAIGHSNQAHNIKPTMLCIKEPQMR